MMNKKTIVGLSIGNRVLLAAVLLLLLTGNTSAQPMPKAAQLCVACHGIDGYSPTPLWPNLAGQKAGYLADQLKNFRSGARKDASMAPMVRGLTDKDIYELAEYYAAKPLRVTANGNAAKVEAGEHASAYCVSCHGMKGQTANTEWPNLAGQHAAYLQKQLRAFRDGTRDSINMNTIVAGYTDEQIEALAAYYSQLQP